MTLEADQLAEKITTIEAATEAFFHAQIKVSSDVVSLLRCKGVNVITVVLCSLAHAIPELLARGITQIRLNNETRLEESFLSDTDHDAELTCCHILYLGKDDLNLNFSSKLRRVLAESSVLLNDRRGEEIRAEIRSIVEIVGDNGTVNTPCLQDRLDQPSARQEVADTLTAIIVFEASDPNNYEARATEPDCEIFNIIYRPTDEYAGISIHIGLNPPHRIAVLFFDKDPVTGEFNCRKYKIRGDFEQVKKEIQRRYQESVR